MPCRLIYCPTSELYRYDGIPLRRDVDHSILIDIGQLHWQILMKQGKSEGFDSCDRPSNLKLDSNRQFSARVTVKFDG